MKTMKVERQTEYRLVLSHLSGDEFQDNPKVLSKIDAKDWDIWDYLLDNGVSKHVARKAIQLLDGESFKFRMED